jgi:glycosyltransferase XagB
MLARLHADAQLPAGHVQRPPDYTFLADCGVDETVLARAQAEAQHGGALLHEVLIARGWLSQQAYAQALARRLAVPAVSWEAEFDPARGPDDGLLGGAALPAWLGGRELWVLDAAAGTPADIAAQVAHLHGRGLSAALAPRAVMDAAREARLGRACVEHAVHGLLRADPSSSAAGVAPLRQVIAGVGAVGLLIGGLAVFPDATLAVLTGLIAIPFLCVTLLRVLALVEALSPARTRQARRALVRSRDHELPTYSILVPLFREANVLSALCRSLGSLDYPAAKHEILLLIEAVDLDTQAAILGMRLPGNFRALVVPDSEPRTKPKALNYALPFARGEFIVVYDAEDRPQPDQLRRAVDAFRRGPDDLGCVQACLNIFNPRQSWFTRQFTIEYSVLFDAMLPALENLRLPVPLGGTSNHFRRTTLEVVGGWDPFNVTEDADLGVRLARLGYRTAVLASTTWEEAPTRFGVWLKQRTRWLKGWMQTYLVHTRSLQRLNRDLGWGAALGFHALMGGLIGSALVQPLFYLLLVWHGMTGQLFAPNESALGTALLMVALINLGLGYLVSMLVGMVAVWRRGRPGLAMHALFMPLYWLLISLAAYRAVYQLFRAPFLWEKTPHGAAREPVRKGSRAAG